MQFLRTSYVNMDFKVNFLDASPGINQSFHVQKPTWIFFLTAHWDLLFEFLLLNA